LRAKLPYLPDWTVRRRAIAERYRAVLSGLPLVVPFEDSRGMHVYHLFVIRTPQRQKLAEHLKSKGIATGIHYPIPLHLQPVYQSMGLGRGAFPVTEQIANEVLSLPIYPELTADDVDRICLVIRDFFS